jgi:hypothetical protein
MSHHLLIPGVKHRQKAEIRTQPAWITTNRE